MLFFSHTHTHTNVINKNIFTAYYINQCSRDDPEVNVCLMHSANRLARLLQVGVPELGMEEVTMAKKNFLSIGIKYSKNPKTQKKNRK